MLRACFVFLCFSTAALADYTEVPQGIATKMVEMHQACGLDTKCTGTALSYCADAIGAGGVPRDWAMCQQVELDWWDAQLNRVYKERMAGLKELDKDAGNTQFQDALRDMQRAWIPYRDARCQLLARGQGPFGSGARNDVMESLIAMTASQAVFIAP